MEGEENEQMGVGEDWACFDVDKEYGGEEMRFFGHIIRKNGMKNRLMQGKMEGKQRPGFERMDEAGHCWCITTGERSGNVVKNHQSHSSADIAT